MRYVIIGAGAIGGVIGARLAQGGSKNEPLLIARGEHGRVIAEHGIRLRTPDEDTVIPIAAAAAPSGVRLERGDVLVFATKTQQIETALLEWADQPVYDGDRLVGTAAELLPVFTALNGVESERRALRYFERVFGVCIWMPAVYLTPGEVISRISPSSGTLIIGRYGSAPDEGDAALLDTLSADLTASTFDVHLVADVMRWKYAKLLGNLANSVQALLGPASSGADRIIAALVAEAENVYRAAGVEWASVTEQDAWRSGNFDIRPVPGVSMALGGSSWQSIARGAGSIESDFLNGEISLIAGLHGDAAPLNAMLQRRARQAAASGSRDAALTVLQLESLLGL